MIRVVTICLALILHLCVTPLFARERGSITYAGWDDVFTKYEQPRVKSKKNIIYHTGFSLQFNTETNCADWVAWELNEYEAATNKVNRTNDFKADDKVPGNHRVEPYDYRGSGYDRGHLCPAGDMGWSYEAMTDCFYMSNICPQHSVLNQRWWEHLESACRRWAMREGRIYICCGPIYEDDSQQYIGNDTKVRVPSAFFKVVLSLKKNEEKAIGFIYRNDGSRQTMDDAAVSVDEVESITGLDFFYRVDDKIEKTVESTFNLKQWR